MPTTYTDQFFLIDPAAPPPGGTTLTVQKFDIIDQNDDNIISRAGGAGDSIDGSDIRRMYPGDTITVTMGGTTVTITGVTFQLADGRWMFTPTDGTVLEDATFISSTSVTGQGSITTTELGPPCFVKGTLIETYLGPRPVEDLRAGDMIVTRDHGVQRLSWVGSRQAAGLGNWAPIRFAPGAIGNDRALLVSPQHRILIEGWQAELYFGTDELLVAARHLVNDVTICAVPMRSVSYHHLMFDRHEVIFSEGAATESLHPGDIMLRDNPSLSAEITSLFPELATHTGRRAWKTARPTATHREARLLREA